jgi:hypothetical protein
MDLLSSESDGIAPLREETARDNDRSSGFAIGWNIRRNPLQQKLTKDSAARPPGDTDGSVGEDQVCASICVRIVEV